MDKKTRVLVVDDDVNFAEGVVDILEEHGYVCDRASNGIEALAKIQDGNIDVILSDIKMPGMNGVKMCREIKKILPELPIIMMTAFREEDLIKDALSEGAYGVIHKPLDIERVITSIERTQHGGAFVMVVDDDPNTRETLKDCFISKGFVVTCVGIPSEALRIAREKPLDIIFMDAKLSTISGLDLYLQIQEINPKAKTVIMTAYRDELQKTFDNAKHETVSAILYKPFDVNEAVKVIEKLVNKNS